VPYQINDPDLPAHVKKLSAKKRRQWVHVWNAAYQKAIDGGASKANAEKSAFAQANGVVGKEQDVKRKSLTEVHVQPLQIVEGEDGAPLHVHAKAQQADIINGNGRVYPRAVLTREVTRLAPLAAENRLVGEVDHPEGYPTIASTGLKITSLALDETGTVVLEADILPTSKGRDLEALVRAGVPVGISSRGYGTLKAGEWEGKPARIVQDDFELESFDAVIRPSVPGAEITHFESEDTDMDLTLEELKEGYADLVAQLEAPLREQVESLTAQVTDLTAQVADLTAKLTASEEASAVLNTRLESLNVEHEALLAKLAAVQETEAALAAAQAEVAELKAALEALTAELGMTEAVVPFHASEKAEEGTKWSADAARDGAWEKGLAAYKAIHAWFDAEDKENKTAYKLPHHNAEGKVVWAGVHAAMAALMGARGGTAIPEGDRAGVKRHLAKHYKQFDKEVPESLEQLLADASTTPTDIPCYCATCDTVVKMQSPAVVQLDSGALALRGECADGHPVVRGFYLPWSDLESLETVKHDVAEAIRPLTAEVEEMRQTLATHEAERQRLVADLAAETAARQTAESTITCRDAIVERCRGERFSWALMEKLNKSVTSPDDIEAKLPEARSLVALELGTPAPRGQPHVDLETLTPQQRAQLDLNRRMLTR